MVIYVSVLLIYLSNLFDFYMNILYNDLKAEDDMQNYQSISLAKNGFKQFSIRLGKIFSNISIVALILCISGMLSFVATAFILLIGLTVIILSIGTIFVMVPDYFDILMSTAQTSAKISEFFLANFYIFASIAVVGAIISLVLLALDKRTKHTGRIVLSSLVLAIAIVTIIVTVMGVV